MRRWILLALILLFSAALPAQAAPTATVYVPMAAQPGPREALAALINAARVADGCPPALLHTELSAAAQAKVDDLAAGRGVLLGDLDYYAEHGYPVTTDVADAMVRMATPEEVAQRLAGAAPGRGALRWCPQPAWAYDLGVGVGRYEGAPIWAIAVSAREP